MAKLFIFTSRGRECTGCGARITVSRPHVLTLSLAMVFGFLLISAAVPRDDPVGRWIIVALLIVLVGRIQLVHIPLVVVSPRDQ